MECMFLRWFSLIALSCLVATPVTAGEGDLPALAYSQWKKFCLGDTCFIGRDGRLTITGAGRQSNIDCGPVVAAVLIERTGDTKKTLRVTLPSRVSLDSGVRIIIDQDQAIERPYVNCFASGCMADYDAGAELVERLKQGRMIVLNAIDKTNSPISLTVPLVGFVNAYDGAASQEPKALEEVVSTEEMHARLDRERRADEDRKARCEAR